MRDQEIEQPTALLRQPITYETALGLIVHVMRSHYQLSQRKFAETYDLERTCISRMELVAKTWTITDMHQVGHPWNTSPIVMLNLAKHIIVMLAPLGAPLVDFSELSQWPHVMTPKHLQDELPDPLYAEVAAKILETMLGEHDGEVLSW